MFLENHHAQTLVAIFEFLFWEFKDKKRSNWKMSLEKVPQNVQWKPFAKDTTNPLNIQKWGVLWKKNLSVGNKEERYIYYGGWYLKSSTLLFSPDLVS